MIYILSSNNTNKLSPQERLWWKSNTLGGSNNTNKLSPQEQGLADSTSGTGSNNTNKLSPQEQVVYVKKDKSVQIIQINLALKNNHLR